jgi:hypothetical protein
MIVLCLDFKSIKLSLLFIIIIIIKAIELNIVVRCHYRVISSHLKKKHNSINSHSVTFSSIITKVQLQGRIQDFVLGGRKSRGVWGLLKISSGSRAEP